ncbi:MAG: hypothetical protein KBB11_07350 [Bacteroidales bacterium]|nr:hypothetical protein [Bacteroidales bacterium]HQP05029.1 hypothetical protein [Bacteroidales bacterium]
MHRLPIILLFTLLCFPCLSQCITARDYLFSGICKRTSTPADLGGSVADFDTAILLQPAFAEAYANRGYSLYVNKDFYGAISDFSKAIQLSRSADSVEWTIPLSVVGDMPGLYACYYLRGVAYFILEDSKSAINELTQAIQLFPEIADAYAFRGDIKTFLTDYKSAVADYDMAIILNTQDPGYFEIYYRRGVAKAELSDYESAILDFGVCIEMNPGFPAAYYYRGLSKLMISDSKGACLDLLHAEDMGFQQAAELRKKHCK